MRLFSCYGLCFSSEFALPYQQGSGPADVVIVRGHRISLEIFSPFNRGIWVNDSQLILHVDGIATYFIEDEHTLSIFTERDPDDPAVMAFLVSAAIPYLMVRRGHTVLRGMALTWDSQSCHIMIGASGVGKSTVLAKLLQEGATLIADQFLVFSQSSAQILPEYRCVKLWKDSIHVLKIPEHEVHAIRPELSYFRWIPPAFCSTVLPIKTVTAVQALNNAPESLEATPIRGFKKLQLFLAQQWGRELLSVWKFIPPTALFSLIQTLPFYSLDYTHGSHSISKICAEFQKVCQDTSVA